MATQNVRVVGYLPPHYREKLHQYMEAESLTESATLVKIVKKFFDGIPAPQATEKAKDDEIARVKADVAQLQQRLTILEQPIASGRRLNLAQSRTSYQRRPQPQPILPPQTSSELARRLGVNVGTVEEAAQKGEDYFKDWSKRIDPTKKSWHKRGELFHPESD